MTDVRLTATNPEDSSVVPVACNEKGELKLEEPLTFNGNLDGDLTVSGLTSLNTLNTENRAIFGTSYKFEIRPFDGGSASQLWVETDEGIRTFNVNGNGSAEFASSKAGFTAEGNLWCTDSRGAIWMLDFVSNGMAQWKAYTPASRRDMVADQIEPVADHIQEKLEEWSEKDKPAGS